MPPQLFQSWGIMTPSRWQCHYDNKCTYIWFSANIAHFGSTSTGHLVTSILLSKLSFTFMACTNLGLGHLLLTVKEINTQFIWATTCDFQQCRIWQCRLRRTYAASFKLNSNCCLVCSYTLNVPIATKVVCFSPLLKCLRSLYDKQCGPRSDCSYRSSLFWVHAVCFYT